MEEFLEVNMTKGVTCLLDDFYDEKGERVIRSSITTIVDRRIAIETKNLSASFSIVDGKRGLELKGVDYIECPGALSVIEVLMPVFEKDQVVNVDTYVTKPFPTLSTMPDFRTYFLQLRSLGLSQVPKNTSVHCFSLIPNMSREIFLTKDYNI